MTTNKAHQMFLIRRRLRRMAQPGRITVRQLKPARPTEMTKEQLIHFAREYVKLLYSPQE